MPRHTPNIYNLQKGDRVAYHETVGDGTNCLPFLFDYIDERGVIHLTPTLDKCPALGVWAGFGDGPGQVEPAAGVEFRTLCHECRGHGVTSKREGVYGSVTTICSVCDGRRWVPWDAFDGPDVRYFVPYR